MMHATSTRRPYDHTVTARIFDKDGGFTEYSIVVYVDNVRPTITAWTGPTLGVRGQGLDYSGLFTDPGILDTHIALITWGDSTTAAGAILETDGSGSVRASHVYTASGTYTITLTVIDKDGAPASSSGLISLSWFSPVDLGAGKR